MDTRDLLVSTSYAAFMLILLGMFLVAWTVIA